MISDAEAVLMHALWASSPMTTEQLLSQVGESQGWQEGTVKSLLNRLLNKGAISAEREGRRYLYSPVLTRDDYVTQQSTSLLDRLFGGRVAPLVAHFSTHAKLSARDKAQLRKLLKELGDE